MVKDIESRQTGVEDFFLIESNCRVRRQSIARRTNGRSGRAARQRQRPSDSQYRYSFCPTPSLRILIAMRHGGGLPFTPRLNVQLYNNDRRKIRAWHPVVFADRPHSFEGDASVSIRNCSCACAVGIAICANRNKVLTAKVLNPASRRLGPSRNKPPALSCATTTDRRLPIV